MGTIDDAPSDAMRIRTTQKPCRGCSTTGLRGAEYSTGPHAKPERGLWDARRDTSSSRMGPVRSCLFSSPHSHLPSQDMPHSGAPPPLGIHTCPPATSSIGGHEFVAAGSHGARPGGRGESCALLRCSNSRRSSHHPSRRPRPRSGTRGRRCSWRRSRAARTRTSRPRTRRAPHTRTVWQQGPGPGLWTRSPGAPPCRRRLPKGHNERYSKKAFVWMWSGFLKNERLLEWGTLAKFAQRTPF